MTVTTSVQLRIPNEPDAGPGQRFTEEAAASLIGQQPRWLVGLDWSRGGPRATVVAASLDADHLLVTVDVDERALEGLTVGDEPLHGGLGYVAKIFIASSASDVAVSEALALCIGPVAGPPAHPLSPRR